MKLLIVTQYFWPENFRINDLAVGLKKRGHEVTVFTGIPNYPKGKFFKGYGFFKNLRQDYNGVKVIRTPLFPRGKGGKVCLALNYFSFAFFASILGPFFCRGKFDLIFVYQPSPVTVGLPALVLKKIKAIPMILWVQDLWPESLSATGAIRSKKIIKIVEHLVLFIYRGCDRILVQSRGFLSYVEKMGFDRSRIKYYPNSAEELYQPVIPEEVVDEQVDMPAGFRIMFGGNIGAAQDFETILNAAEILKEYDNIHWVIIGDGRMRPAVELQMRERGLSKTVHLLGRRSVESMPRYFSLADILLVTLKKKPIFEITIPSKIQSYLACAKPIIAALEGEGAEVIKEASAGITCSAENPEDLVSTILEMYNMSQLERQEMGENGRKYFNKNFEFNMLLTQLENMVEELLKEKAKK